MAEPLVVTQLLVFEWGKEARGGHLAALRRQKVKQELPSDRSLEPNLRSLVQVIEIDGDKLYTDPRIRVREYKDAISAIPTGFTLRIADEQLQVFSALIVKQGVVVIGEGQTARFEYNQRVALEHTWRYQHTIVNIGYTSRPLRPRLFFKEPNHRQMRLSSLYQANFKH